MKKNELNQKVTKKASSTKNLILSVANEIINEGGVIDFRIDTLSTTLKLSPGNITYHFPKKEDIINTIWEECCAEINQSTESYISPLMDIKQLYLYYKFTILTLYKYRGVVCFKLGDIGAVKHNSETEGEELFFEKWLRNLEEILSILRDNNYVISSKDKYIYSSVIQSSFVNIFWSIHSAAVFNMLRPTSSDKFAAVAIFQLYPILTESGTSQLHEIYNIISKIKE